jgi:hypothetical protein
MLFSSCRLRTEFEIYRITIVNSQGIVLFEKEGRLGYSRNVKTFNGEAYADIYVEDRADYKIIYQVSGVGIQIMKEYIGSKPHKAN